VQKRLCILCDIRVLHPAVYTKFRLNNWQSDTASIYWVYSLQINDHMATCFCFVVRMLAWWWPFKGWNMFQRTIIYLVLLTVNWYNNYMIAQLDIWRQKRDEMFEACGASGRKIQDFGGQTWRIETLGRPKAFVGVSGSHGWTQDHWRPVVNTSSQILDS
jgi:hypothetical protein